MITVRPTVLFGLIRVLLATKRGLLRLRQAVALSPLAVLAHQSWAPSRAVKTLIFTRLIPIIWRTAAGMILIGVPSMLRGLTLREHKLVKRVAHRPGTMRRKVMRWYIAARQSGADQDRSMPRDGPTSQILAVRGSKYASTACLPIGPSPFNS